MMLVKHIQMNGYTFYATFTKGNNIYDFLFTPMNGKALRE